MYSDKIVEVVRTLIKINRSVIQGMEGRMDHMKKDCPMAYAKEFKTVKVAACRRAGHTSSIMPIAAEIFH